MMDLSNTNHPIWATIRLVALLITMTVILYSNASSFDTTEIKAIVEMFLLAASVEGGVKIAKAFASGRGNTERTE